MVLGAADAGGNGEFTISRPAPGTYYVHTTNVLGYVNKTADGISCVGGCELQGPVVLTAAATRTIDFVLEPGAVVSGFVRDAATRAPVSGMRVFLYDARQRVVAAATSI